MTSLAPAIIPIISLPKSLTHLEDVEANVGGHGVGVRVLLLLGVRVQQAHGPVGRQAALLAEDQQCTGLADFQVVGQQEGDGLAQQGVNLGVGLQITHPQAPGAKLQAELVPFAAQLYKETFTHTRTHTHTHTHTHTSVNTSPTDDLSMTVSLERIGMQTHLCIGHFDEGEYGSDVGSSRSQLLALRQESQSRRVGSEK